MNFASIEFLCFLFVLVAAYYLVPKRAQWVVLLAGSVVFYAFAGVTSCLFLLAVIVISYVSVRLIGKRQSACAEWLAEHKELPKEERKAYKNKSKKGNLAIVCVGIAVLTAALVYTKFVSGYFGFKVSASGISFGAYALEIMGISYYTFIAIGYMLDVYREKAPVQKNFAKHALFVGFFPQLVMGPISKYADVGEQYFETHTLQGKNLYTGAVRIAWGFFKKL
ncbi:MAG: MBOAT family protein, partial [Clostridia bacterium]|nr:MBOAT family protein [Clostridia bacterium]